MRGGFGYLDMLTEVAVPGRDRQRKDRVWGGGTQQEAQDRTRIRAMPRVWSEQVR